MVSFIRPLVMNHIYPISFIRFFSIFSISLWDSFLPNYKTSISSVNLSLSFSPIFLYHAVLYFNSMQCFLLCNMSCLLYPVDLYFPQMSIYPLYHFLFHLYFHISDCSTVICIYSTLGFSSSS